MPPELIAGTVLGGRAEDDGASSSAARGAFSQPAATTIALLESVRLRRWWRTAEVARGSPARALTSTADHTETEQFAVLC